MKSICIALTVCVLGVGCGDKAKETQAGTGALTQFAKVGNSLEVADAAGKKVLAARRAKGDTLAMPYKDLQNFLPSAPNGYNVEGGPTGQQASMGAFSTSVAEQKYRSPSDGRTVHVVITDYGASEAGYSMLMMFSAVINTSSEDDHRRNAGVQTDVPTTYASEEYNKDNKTSKVTVGTRYRYLIAIEAANQTQDVTKELMTMATEIARKFADK